MKASMALAEPHAAVDPRRSAWRHYGSRWPRSPAPSCCCCTATWRDMVWIWWNNSTYSHILLVPPILAWLVRQRRPELARLAPQPWCPALALVGAGGLLLDARRVRRRRRSPAMRRWSLMLQASVADAASGRRSRAALPSRSPTCCSWSRSATSSCPRCRRSPPRSRRAARPGRRSRLRRRRVHRHPRRPVSRSPRPARACSS